MRYKLAAALFVVACSVLHAESAAIDVPYQRFVLKNGLSLIVHEDHKAPIVAVNVWYHVGSKNERPGKTGFAHLFEHLMFGGSEHHQRRYIEAMEPIGATDLNGTTNSIRAKLAEKNAADDFRAAAVQMVTPHAIGAFLDSMAGSFRIAGAIAIAGAVMAAVLLPSRPTAPRADLELVTTVDEEPLEPELLTGA